MKPLAVVLIAVVAGSAPALVTSVLASPSAGGAERSTPVESPRLAQLELALEELRADQRRLAESLEAVGAKLASPAETTPRVPVGAIEAAVERALADRGETVARRAASEPAEDADAEAADAELELADVLVALRTDDFANDYERQEFWQRIRDAGLIDEVIARYEERAEDFPTDPDVQVDLGEVYLQKIFEVGDGPLAGLWATKADGAFDAALALDDRHWGARFQKAAALSFWPPVFGKQSEAIQQFEILTEQQDALAPEARHAQTYLLLGNLYQQNGKPEKAVEAWERGLERFPDEVTLIEQLENAD